MEKFILIGIPNCGKTTLGKKIAEKLNLPFYDTDSMTSDILKLKRASDVFRSALNGSFLEAQYQAVVELSKLKGPAIIATGAEATLAPECAGLLKKMGTVINIQRKTELALESVKKGWVMVNENTGEETPMNEEAVRLYSQENYQYKALADMSLDNNGSEDEGVDKLDSCCLTSLQKLS